MKQLEKKFRSRTVILSAVLLAIGLLITLVYFREYLPIGEEQNLDEITVDQIHEGRAKITVYYIYDYYCYFTDEYGKEVQRDYFVCMGPDGDKYVGVELRGKKNDRAYQLMNDIYDAEAAGQELDYDKLGYFTVKGNIQKLTGDDLEYYEDYLKECAAYYDMSMDELREIFAPYVLIAAKAGARDEKTDYVVVIAGVILIISGICVLISGLFGNHMKDLKDFVNRNGSEEAAYARLDRFVESTPERYGMRVNDDFFMVTNGMSLVFSETKDVIWIYPYIVTHKTYFVTTGKTYYVRLRFANGKMAQVQTKKENNEEVMNYLARMIPDAIFGYSDDLERMFNKDRGRMIAEVNRRRDERLGNISPSQTEETTQPQIPDTSDISIPDLPDVSISDQPDLSITDQNKDDYTGSMFN
ncbi:MAG: hypothetical protein ILN61_06155 [Lachnospiraceae bacterium]|nr:hypothetical protein [Lachnospiraceae bacterium]